MRAITNTEIIEKRSKWAKRIAPLAMYTLLGGFILNLIDLFNAEAPQYTSLTFLLLMVGFVLAIISSHMVNRWVREPRADQVLSSTLKKFGNDFILFNYITSPPHILLTPAHLYVLVVKRHSGQVTVNGKRFTRKFSWSRVFRFFADEGLGAPVAEAENEAGRLYKLLNKHLSAEEMPEITALIVFVDNNVELTVNDPVIPVMRSNELKTYLREQDKQRTIPAALKNTLVEIIGGERQTSGK
ncbi:MAG: NERD domain-containing protein [Anaerolineae bacterium]|nr:NERD domain-containing protein [Anaerolineae bacterium]